VIRKRCTHRGGKSPKQLTEDEFKSFGGKL